MSQSSSSNGSAAEFIRVVEQLIDSDQQEKNIKKMTALKAQFPVLRKIHPFMPNQQKLHLFFLDPHFRGKVQEKLMEKGTYMPNGIPILKVYLVSTRYGASVAEEFQQNDIVALFQRFGVIDNVYVSNRIAFISFQQTISTYLATKVLNQFHISDYVRLCVKLCSEDEGVQAHSLFLSARNGAFTNFGGSVASSNHSGPIQTQKYIAKFLFEVEILPEFNIAQRIIGPRGSYLKNIIDKVLGNQVDSVRHQASNIDSLVKIRLRGKGSGFQQNIRSQPDEKMHLFVSSRNKDIQQQACQELDKLLAKIFQDYKVHYQKIYRRYAYGVAYTVLQYEGSYFIEVRKLMLEDVETKIDILSLENHGKLGEMAIENKIKEREKMRKQGRFKQADEIRDWLKSKGVKITDSKGKGKKCSWTYELP